MKTIQGMKTEFNKDKESPRKIKIKQNLKCQKSEIWKKNHKKFSSSRLYKLEERISCLKGKAYGLDYSVKENVKGKRMRTKIINNETYKKILEL